MDFNCGAGQDLYIEAKKIIPGGTQLLSKRPEMFLPEQWPSYYKKAKGCEVWDLDDRHYYDVSYMGIGACVNGYANDIVDEAAIEAARNGVMCTLNAPEEVYLAEKLLELHPWAGGVRFAKAGGEIVSLAIRLARAYTQKDKILFCGYHGWHDWYLAANLSEKDELKDHHIPGLKPAGVPKGLAGTMFPFHYNNYDEFLDLFQQCKHELAAVIMEPIRNDWPKDGFLEKIREATSKANVPLIFDEISAGFRLCPGGSHKVLGINPDIATFAKGMTNGYPLSAVIGRKDIMDAAQDTFISSTFFTERVAFAATLKNIELYEQNKVWEHQINIGRLVKEGWEDLANFYGLKISIGGIDPLAHFSFVVENPLIYKTYITQELLKKGYLSANALYASISHTPEIINKYLNQLGEVFAKIDYFQKHGVSLSEKLEGSVCHSGFGRLL